MSENVTKQTGPLQNLFADMKKILDITEFKDLAAATNAETTRSKAMAELWMNAMVEADSFVTYRKWWTKDMFQEVENNVRNKDVAYYMENPFHVPLKFRDTLYIRGRQAFLDEYEEENDYYRMLNGLPPMDTPSSEFIYLSRELQNQLHVGDVPVHKLSTYVQNNYMGTDEYKRVLEENPDKTYLRYLGTYKINIYAARNARDFEIIRYPVNRSDINPNLINVFSALYADCREYVMATLYNKEMEGLYANYRTFMGVLILSYALFQLGNKAVESTHDRKYLDDTVLHIILSMYGIPETLLMTKEVRRDLAIHLLKLVKEKGTDEVYYDLIQILGYQDVVVSKLMLMKGQQFDPNNNYKATEEVEPYFLQLDLKDKNPYETITSGKAPIYSYHSIIDNDPMWWDLPDVREILNNSAYTTADSKYIVIEAVVHQMKYIFEAIYFTRMVLDNKSSTDEYLIEIPEIFGTEMVSIYDLILFIICATCMTNNLTGEIVTQTDRLIATAGFNFDMDIDTFTDFVNTTKYVDKTRLMKFMENLTMQSSADISRLFNDVMYPLREWLEGKISAATNRKEYVEYEAIYRALFTYDITRNKFLDDFEMPMETIRKKYDLTNEEILAFKNFYPHTFEGKAVTVDEFNQSTNTTKYRYPFLSYNDSIDWYIHIVTEHDGRTDDRGYVYFYDILNCPDLRELTNPDGTRVFMDYEDGDIGWQINQQAVDQAIYLLEHLEENDLAKAYFQIFTPVPNSDVSFTEGTRLPANIRTGVFKSILRDKVEMDMKGLAVPPKTYFECLSRKNQKLYNLLLDPATDRFHKNKDAWMNDIMTIVLAMEAELSVHMKYFEQSIMGEEFFFKPLVTLIKHFKSILVDIAKTGLKYVFDDKMDAGGNSHMFKIFDDAVFVVHFSTIAGSGYESQFGLFDAEHSMNYRITLKDRSEILRMVIGEGFAAEVREARMGSLHLVDEMKFFKNGKDIDPSGQYPSWYSGEPGTGRWSEEDDILMRARKENTRITNLPVDLEGWKDFVESYCPVE